MKDLLKSIVSPFANIKKKSGLLFLAITLLIIYIIYYAALSIASLPNLPSSEFIKDNLPVFTGVPALLGSLTAGVFLVVVIRALGSEKASTS